MYKVSNILVWVLSYNYIILNSSIFIQVLNWMTKLQSWISLLMLKLSALYYNIFRFYFLKRESVLERGITVLKVSPEYRNMTPFESTTWPKRCSSRVSVNRLWPMTFNFPFVGCRRRKAHGLVHEWRPQALDGRSGQPLRWFEWWNRSGEFSKENNKFLNRFHCWEIASFGKHGKE